MENLITSSESLALENFRKREVIEDAFCPTYSPTGNSFAYIARRDQKYLVVKDGVEGDRYDHIYALTYSPDGNSFAYVAKKDGKYLIVKDGVE